MKSLSDLLVEYGESFAETTPATDDHALTLLHEFALAVGAINYPDAYLVDLLGDSLNDQWPHLLADGLQYQVASAVLKGLCGLELDQVSPFAAPAAVPHNDRDAHRIELIEDLT